MRAVTSRIFRLPAVTSIDVPSPSSHEVRVRVHAAGINPADVKLSALALSGRVCGCEWAGIVESIGSNVDNVKVGDRVAGFAAGGNNVRTAAFADLLCTPVESIFRIPDTVSMSEAASLGVGLVTSILTFRQFLGYPDTKGTNKSRKGFLADYQGPILIWSAATSFGIHAIQLSKILDPSRVVITTASKRNHDLLRSVGADHCFDYNDKDVVEKIRELGAIRAAIDTFGEKNTTEMTARCLSGSRGNEALVVSSQPSMPFSSPKLPPHVKLDHVMSYTATGRAVRVAFIMTYPASVNDYTEANEMMSCVSNWLESGALKAMPRKDIGEPVDALAKDISGSIDVIVRTALPLVGSGAMRGEKLIVHLRREERNDRSAS